MQPNLIQPLALIGDLSQVALAQAMSYGSQVVVTTETD